MRYPDDLELTYFNILDRLAEMVIRKAVGYENNIRDALFPQSLSSFIEHILETLPMEIVEKEDNIYRCKLCGKGPFTRKGLYLHLKRVHIDQIIHMIKSELDYYLWQVKNF